jgi:hypothetical protein
MGYQFLDGQIALRLGPNQPIQDMSLNGKFDLTIGGGKFRWVCRTNIFDRHTGAGFAFLSEFQRTPQIRSIQACTLAGGDPHDVSAGTLVACLNK